MGLAYPRNKFLFIESFGMEAPSSSHSQKKRKGRFWRSVLYGCLTLALLWLLLTLWVQLKGPSSVERIGTDGAPKTSLVVYDPDPIYDLDEQVGRAFARGLADHGFSVQVASVRSADRLEGTFDLYVFCANTYNWAPDWQTVRFIKRHPELAGKDAVAITLGAGSTGRSKRLLEAHLRHAGMRLSGSETYWLLRPNDESRLDEKNVEVAVDKARTFGRKIGARLSTNQGPESG